MKSLLALVGLMACFSWTVVAWSADEGVAIEKVVKEAAMASAPTPKPETSKPC